MQKIYTSLLHYKAYSQLRLSLQRLKKLRTSKNFSLVIVVVDNESDKKELQKLQKLFPAVIFLPQKENIGATNGFNVGYRYGISHGADFLAMLSPDLEMKSDALEKLINVMNKDKSKKVGIAACKMLIKTKPPKIFFVQGLLDSRVKTPIHVGIGNVDKGQYDSTTYNDFLNCPMIIRKEVFKKVGYFQPELFMYYEDTDWHTRIRKAGFSLICVKDAIAWNLQPDRDLILRPKKEYYLARNHLWFVKHNFSLIDQCIAYLYTFKNLLVMFVSNKKVDKERFPYNLLGIKDFFLNNMGKKEFSNLL